MPSGTAEETPLKPLTIWCNLRLPPAVRARLEAGVAPHALRFAPDPPARNAPAGRADPSLATADIAFGQPDAAQCASLQGLRFVQLSSAGYTSFDTPAVRGALAARAARLATSSAVYSDPCAQHVVAFLLAEARQLPRSLRHQLGDRAWTTAPTRAACRLLGGQEILLVGYGSIARRIAALLAPFGAAITGVRREVRGDEDIPVVPLRDLRARLGAADHVVNLLPANAESRGLFDARAFAAMKPDAAFYNIGRGTTVDQDALAAALASGHVRAAYLDVTEPEPLPADHPLWAEPRCTITPHAAGGHHDEHARLVEHFLANLARFLRGEPLADQIV